VHKAAFNNVEFIAAREIGAETPNYVANIYKYYLAYKMTTEQDARRQVSRSAHLPPARSDSICIQTSQMVWRVILPAAAFQAALSNLRVGQSRLKA
jgi:hypothetical protein